MIRIEILSVDANNVSAAFYYEIKDNTYSSNSIDPTRAPSGSGLDATELQLLRDGRLYETIRNYDAYGKTTPEIQSFLQTKWNSQKNVAKNEYIAAYSYSGTIWDGSSWT